MLKMESGHSQIKGLLLVKVFEINAFMIRDETCVKHKWDKHKSPQHISALNINLSGSKVLTDWRCVSYLQNKNYLF